MTDVLTCIKEAAQKIKDIAKKNVLENNDFIREGDFDLAWIILFDSIESWKHLMEGYVLPYSADWLNENSSRLPQIMPGLEWGELTPEELQKVRKVISFYLKLYKALYPQ